MSKKITPELLAKKVEEARVGMTDDGIYAVDCSVVVGYVKDDEGRRCQVTVKVSAAKDEWQ